MTNINLNDKVKGPLVAGLAALSLGAGGCATMSETERQEWRDWATVTGSVLRLSGILTGDVQDAAVGDTLLRGAEVASMSEIARKGGTQVHVYPERERSRVYMGCEEFSGYRGIDDWVVNRYGDCVPAENNQVTRGRLSPEGQRNKERVAREMEMGIIDERAHSSVDSEQGITDENFRNSKAWPRDKFYSFAYNYFEDFDGNSSIGPNELVGIKSSFREDERFGLYFTEASNIGRVNGTVDLEVYSPRGEIVYTSEMCDGKLSNEPSKRTTSFDASHRTFYVENVFVNEFGKNVSNYTCDKVGDAQPILPFLSEKGGYGNYKAIWKIDGRYRASNEFEIVPSIENRN